jgi:predicted acetyltransferase
MNITITPVNNTEKQILANMTFDYQSEMFNSKRIEPYKHLESYFEQKQRYPLFITLEKNIVGFVLVNDHVLIEPSAKNMAEFYIIKNSRNNGIGRVAAKLVFDLFPGYWEVRQMSKYMKPVRFWRNVIANYTHNNFKEITLNDEQWSGTIQVFKTPTN